MSDWQNRTAGIKAVVAGVGGDSHAPWPWDAPGRTQPDAADPFSLVKPAGGAGTTAAAAPDPADVLDRLKREAEAALCDPNYVSAHASFHATSTAPIPAQGDPKPLQALAREANHADSLMDMLGTAGRIDSLIGSQQSLEGQELFSPPAAPDVLWLFAGDIAPARRRDVTAPLTRREHHLVLMDSAYRPALAQTPDSDHDA
ncbi:TagK domain-containing protein [Cupriavidus sp. MP-37]|uniref:TagK domain-containing protein n=1 Tax=Cupriavidus sp. MP-37 TaxID=2884455 RepID=UPI001D0A3938|nr:TagK domain-containing protein [Cupriavidus sp. MP-37]UDM49826.1 TagK domain-containing protein [Cupriavidus sp. MP-37]